MTVFNEGEENRRQINKKLDEQLQIAGILKILFLDYNEQVENNNCIVMTCSPLRGCG